MDELNKTTAVASPPKRKRRIGRFLLRALLVLIAILVVAQLIFTYSGSGQWEKLGTRKGVTVYAMKTPGENAKKFKATWKMRSTLSRFVMFSREEESDLTIGYYDMRDLGWRGDKQQWSSWKQKFPAPFAPRHFVTKNEFWQDPVTHELIYEVTAAPDKLPPDDCCVRVPIMNNTWRLTPLPNGELDVEWITDLDMGGFFPYFTANVFQPSGMYYFAPKVQGYLDRDKYKNATYPWIKEGPPPARARAQAATTPQQTNGGAK